MAHSIEIKPSKIIIQACNEISRLLYPKDKFINGGRMYYILSKLTEDHPNLINVEHTELYKLFKVAVQRKAPGLNYDLISSIIRHFGENNQYDMLYYDILKIVIPNFNIKDQLSPCYYNDMSNTTFFRFISFLTKEQLKEFFYIISKMTYKVYTIGDLCAAILNVWDSDIFEFEFEGDIINQLMNELFNLSTFNNGDPEIYFDKDELRDSIVEKLNDVLLEKDRRISGKNKRYVFIDTMASYIEGIFTNEEYKFFFVSSIIKNDAIINYDISEASTRYKHPNSIVTYCINMALLYKGAYQNKTLSEKAEFFINAIKGYYCNIALLKNWDQREIETNRFLSYERLDYMDLFYMISAQLKRLDSPLSDEESSKICREINETLNKPRVIKEISSVSPATECYIPDEELPQYDNIDQVMEAYNKANVTASKVINKGYSAYKTFLNNAKPIDSQLDKLSVSMKNMVMGNKRKEIIEGKEYTPWTLVKKLLGGYMIFNVSKTIFFLGLLTRFVLGDQCSKRERRKIVSELTTEIELLDEKIEDAKTAGDNKAKYEMMRTRAELKKTLTQIKAGLQTADDKATKKTYRVLKG